MMDLVHSHKFPKLYDLQKEKTWKQAVGMGISDRVGKRVGILGYGSIGRQGTFHHLLFFFSSYCWWIIRVVMSWEMSFERSSTMVSGSVHPECALSYPFPFAACTP
jgi:hypothetical protein